LTQLTPIKFSLSLEGNLENKVLASGSLRTPSPAVLLLNVARRDLKAAMSKNGMRPVHPGEVLREDYLMPLGLTASALAKALNVPAPRINDTVRERRGVNADTAMRLARYFGGDARSWLNLQAAYDLRVAEILNAKRIEREISPAAA
jgi:addiction module HigA family antidote